MDLLKTLQSLEELLYEIALWIILLPKTLFKVLLRPRWARSYIAEEWEKEASDRYEYYMSPIFFWVIIGVIPTVLIVEYYLSSDRSRDLPLIFTENIVLIVTSFLTIGPLGVAISIQKARGASIGKKSLKQVFYTQCLCFGPFSLLFFPALIIFFATSIKGDQINMHTYHASRLIMLISLGWLYFAEVNVIRLELNVSKWKAAGILTKGLFISYSLYAGFAWALATGIRLLISLH